MIKPTRITAMKRYAPAALISATLLAACGGGSGTPAVVTPPPVQTPIQSVPETVKSSLARDSNPSTSASDMAAVAAANTDFAFRLLPQVTEADANMVFSPYSVTQAMAMAAAGARGTTLSGIEKALAFPLTQSRFLPALNGVDQKLRAKAAAGPQLNIVNDIWSQKGYAMQAGYLDALAVHFGAGVHLVDYQNATEAARTRINDYIATNTNQKITNLLPQGAVTSNTRVVLTNAIWFKAEWTEQFQALHTGPRVFHAKSGDRTLQFMNRGGTMAYASGSGWQAVDLPYTGDKLSMMVVLPDQGKMDAVLAQMNGAKVAEMASALTPRQVVLSLPKFKFTASASLGKPLQDFGAADAFMSGAADFSGMSGNRDLFISGVLHKAFIAVDEKGTEAAAATGVVVGVTSVQIPPPDEVRFIADRPFLFVIRDRETGLVIFVGKVMLPTQD
jgi:serpin B